MNLAFDTIGNDAMKKLSIDECVFWNEIRYECNFHDEAPLPLYLDLKTGRVFRARGSAVDANYESSGAIDGRRPHDSPANRIPSRYSMIPRFEHSDYGNLLRAFLDSDWTQDLAAKERARRAYSPSIGRWMKQVDDPTAIDAFFRFRDSKLKQRVTDFLHCAGIDPEWN